MAHYKNNYRNICHNPVKKENLHIANLQSNVQKTKTPPETCHGPVQQKEKTPKKYFAIHGRLNLPCSNTKLTLHRKIKLPYSDREFFLTVVIEKTKQHMQS